MLKHRKPPPHAGPDYGNFDPSSICIEPLGEILYHVKNKCKQDQIGSIRQEVFVYVTELLIDYQGCFRYEDECNGPLCAGCSSRSIQGGFSCYGYFGIFWFDSPLFPPRAQFPKKLSEILHEIAENLVKQSYQLRLSSQYKASCK